MEMKLKPLKRAFSDVYGSNYNPTGYIRKEYTGTQRLAPSMENVYVFDCFFYSCLNPSGGGAVYCSSSVYRLLIEDSSFISCKTSSAVGGAIYFCSTANGECALSRICGFDCSSTNTGTGWTYGQFARVETKTDVKAKIHINDSSIAHTSKDSSSSEMVLNLFYGNILIPSSNLTNNECLYIPVLYCSPVTSSEVETFCMSYSSIVNNTANGRNGCLSIYQAISSQRIDTCNIIDNKQTSTSGGTIDISGNMLIRDSCILGNNKGYKVFYQATSSCKITISNCTIDDDIFTASRYYGSVTVNKNIERAFINALSHIATRICDSYFDSYGTLTMKQSTPTRKPRYLISCNYNRPMNDLISSMQFTFLLTMLPSC
jgi:hypothetical protein